MGGCTDWGLLIKHRDASIGGSAAIGRLVLKTAVGRICQ